jgi:hypothetical protein
MSKFKDIGKIEESRGGVGRFGELSASDLERVAGSAGCWFIGTSPTGGTGWYNHGSYPPDH